MTSFINIYEKMINEWRRFCIDKVERLIVERKEGEQILSSIRSYGGEKSFWYVSQDLGIALCVLKIEILKIFCGEKS